MPQDQNPLDALRNNTALPTNPLDELRQGNVSDNPLDVLSGRTQQPPILSQVGTRIGETIGSIPGVQSVLGGLSPLLSFLARPSYSSAKFADSLADESKSVLDAAIDAYHELTAGTILNPDQQQSKITYSDVIRRRFPQFAIDNPNATTLLGFVGDVALDPTSYLGAGLTKEGIKIGGKVLTNPALRTFTEGLQEASKVAFI